ncbi:MAG: hypothetical protein ABL860_01170, partial [Candidatus Nitrotoga sp.]
METTQKPKTWGDASLLRSIKNPTTEGGYEIAHSTEELTFLGDSGQPDYAKADIIFYPKERIIELKSLKLYFYSFRMVVISYERLINVVYADLMRVYTPDRLRLVMNFSTRGGFNSRLVKDSDWKVNGGKEKY